MVVYKTIIKKFDQQGEKTGWIYIEVPADIAQTLKPGNKKSFRVKGSFDRYVFKSMALLPMGGGNFIIPLKADVRKAIGKRHGAMLNVKLAVDKAPFEFSKELMACLADEPAALIQFKSFTGSHQKYFSNWIESAKTAPTKAKRIAMTVNAMLRKMDFGAMLREEKAKKL
ncbi:MAG: DUF1905 domain-containing protein [Sphingobacteriales bacterium]|nr:DUF1905 domain-containing protein [Sphingobacteriales bacterium]